MVGLDTSIIERNIKSIRLKKSHKDITFYYIRTILDVNGKPDMYEFDINNKPFNQGIIYFSPDQLDIEYGSISS